MSEELAIQMLKYIGIALVPIAFVWGLLRKTTFEDAHGNKILTRSGYVAIAITLCIALASAGAFGVETVVKSQERKTKAQTEANRKLEEARRDERELLHLAITRATGAAARERAAKQETLSLALAGEERARQLALQQDVNRGSALNLAKAEVALGQLSRLLQPVGAPEVRLVLQLQGQVSMSRELEGEISTLIASFNSNLDTEGVPATRLFFEGRSLLGLTGSKGSPIYPTRDLDSFLYNAVSRSEVKFVFFARTSEELSLHIPKITDIISGFTEKGDYSFFIRGYENAIEYDGSRRPVKIHVRGAPAPGDIVQGGTLASVPDFEKATLWIYLGMHELRDTKPDNLMLRLAGREYFFASSDFREINLPNGETVWELAHISDHQVP